ncbi:unnamed protein product [Clonostachys byssicola]|uniref:Ankyrin repeat protein n=1 Tax=Clonostachys byssicola TaxID=160290 RepID=A0A9N9Y590_9HYPO|nr:unnamed protein product [Clonostachys byssicola]
MPGSINIDRDNGPIGEEGEGSSEIHVSDNSRSPSIRHLGAAVATQPQSSESTDILPKRKDVLEKIRALLQKFEHDIIRESDGRHQETQVKENSGLSLKDSVEKQVIYTDDDKLKDLLKELASLGTEEYVDDVTALAFKASLDLPEVIETLIEAGALVDKFDENGYTLLHNACRHGQTSTVKKIIERIPTSINQRATDWEYTPLHLAVQYQQKGVGETLLNAGAEINSQDTDGWTPLMTATNLKCADIMDILLCQKDIVVDMPDNNGLTPLLVATKSRFLEGVEKLLGGGANCNGGPDGGEKCLHWAMLRFSRPIFDLFMEVENLIIDVQDSEGKTALHYACGSRHQEMNIGVASYEDETTGTEKKFDFTEIIGKLLGREADPWMTTRKNKTALHFALKHRRSDCNKLLPMFSIRAEHLAPSDWDEELLIHVLFKNRRYANNEDVLNYLMSILSNAPKELDETLQWAVASHSRHEFAKYLFSKNDKEDIDNAKSSWSALRWAIYYRRQELLWWLLATSPRNTVMENQIKAAQMIEQNEEWTTMKKGKPKDGISKTEKEEKEKLNQQDDRKIWCDIQDILNNPPLAQIYRQDMGTNTLEPPELNLKCGVIPDGFESLIVRFYKERTNSNFIRLSRRVDETIYGTGVTRLMKNEAKKLQEILDIGKRGKQLKKLSRKYQTMYDDEKVIFTWVHLPATNRIMIDEKKTADDYRMVNSFLRDTWFEIPDRESPSRIMRPQFVQRKIPTQEKNVDVEEEDFISVSAVYTKMSHHVIQRREM